MLTADSNVAVGAASPNTRVSPSYTGHQAPSISNRHQNEDFFHRTYQHPLKQDNSSIIAHSHLSSSSSKNRQRNTCDPDYNLCFPGRVFRMLNNIDQQSEHLSHIVSWHESGMSFLIHKPDSFIKQVMPLFFRSQTKLTSFQRQLNNYGFRRIQQEGENAESLTYYHKHFLRDEPKECRNVKVKRSKRLSTALDKKFPSIYNKAKQIQEEERLCLTLKIIHKLYPLSASGDGAPPLLKDIFDTFSPPGNVPATPPPLSALRLVALVNTGDTLLDEAADAIYYDNSQEYILQECGFTATTPSTSTHASFWDPEIEALDISSEGIWI